MKSATVSVTPEGNIKDGLMTLAGKGGIENPSGKGWSAVDQPDYATEEASGKVYPTTAPSPENGDEKSSRVTPETPEPSSSGQTGGIGRGSGQTTSGQRNGQTAGTGQGNDQAAVPGQESGQAAVSGQGGGQVSSQGMSKTDLIQKGNEQAESGRSQAATETKAPADDSAFPPIGDGGEADDRTASTVGYKVCTVIDRETLYDICFKLYHNLQRIDEICRVDSLTDKNSIFAGQKLLAP